MTFHLPLGVWVETGQRLRELSSGEIQQHGPLKMTLSVFGGRANIEQDSRFGYRGGR